MFAFARRKKSLDVSPYIRRICDLTTPNLIAPDDSARLDLRCNRTIPTLVVPWVETRPVTEQGLIALTRDLGDRSAGLVLSHPLRAETLVLGFWVTADDSEGPWFFFGTPRRTAPIGGGYWTLGVELTEFANPEYGEFLEPLLPLARKLLPPLAAATA